MGPTPAPTPATYDFVNGANCGRGLEIVSAEACKAAADALGFTYNKESMNGKWTHTPPGCFVHKGCTQGCRLHFGTGNGDNNGNFRAICNVAQASTTTVPVRRLAASSVDILWSWCEGEYRYWLCQAALFNMFS